jgi:TusA-related sulfurtransferase
METNKLDNRGLRPPQPMMRTLEQLEKMQPGETLIIINDRRPMFLYPELDEMGYTHETEPYPDGGYQITIHKV